MAANAPLAVPTPVLDAQAVRRDFPILATSVNGHPLVYLDSAASSQRPLPVLRAIEDYERHSHANVHRGVHALSQAATAAFEGARERVRRFINARSVKEIIFVRGTTEGINLVAQAYARPRFRAGDEILISALEHHANIVPWQMVCEQTGCTLKVAPINRRGELEVEKFLGLLGPRTRLVALAHVSNALGTVLPVKRLIEAAHRPSRIRTSTCARSAPTSTPSPGTSSTGRPGSACSTGARSCSPPCRRGRAAAT
jgi:cysteine desulfurase/selenocysteine lyase